MNNSEAIKKKIHIMESLTSDFKTSIDKRIDRFLEINHREMIGGLFFSEASSECIYLYRDGYFISTVMMSHAINEGIIKFVIERNNIKKHKQGVTKEIEELINELKEKNIISKTCADASIEIYKSYRNDVHHMNNAIAKIPFKELAKKNIQKIAIIENEIFGYELITGTLKPHQPKYWDFNDDGTITAFLRFI